MKRKEEDYQNRLLKLESREIDLKTLQAQLSQLSIQLQAKEHELSLRLAATNLTTGQAYRSKETCPYDKDAISYAIKDTETSLYSIKNKEIPFAIKDKETSPYSIKNKEIPFAIKDKETSPYSIKNKEIPFAIKETRDSPSFNRPLGQNISKNESRLPSYQDQSELSIETQGAKGLHIKTLNSKGVHPQGIYNREYGLGLTQVSRDHLYAKEISRDLSSDKSNSSQSDKLCTDINDSIEKVNSYQSENTLERRYQSNKENLKTKTSQKPRLDDYSMIHTPQPKLSQRKSLVHLVASRTIEPKRRVLQKNTPQEYYSLDISPALRKYR